MPSEAFAAANRAPSAEEATAAHVFDSKKAWIQVFPPSVERQMPEPATATSLLPSAEEAMPNQMALVSALLRVQVWAIAGWATASKPQPVSRNGKQEGFI